MKRNERRLACAMVLLWSSAIAIAQEKAPDAKDNSPHDPLAQAAAHMDRCEVRLADDSDRIIPRSEKPLLIYGDSARRNSNGTLWSFGAEGRPLAMLELYQGNQEKPPWVHAVTLTGSERVQLKTPASGMWRPMTTQIEPAVVPEAPAPLEREPQRLRQMKEIARRFTAHEFWDPDNSRFELRLLVQPVLRYRDENRGILDGAAFVLAHGTNPEVILLIEAHGAQPPQWRYSLARLGSAEMHVELDGREVWMRGRTPGVVGVPTDPYWLFVSPVEFAAESPQEPPK
jgi:hypothetical protein